MILTGLSSKYNLKFYLGNESNDPNDVVDGIGEEASKHVPLAVDLASVDFVEQCHHDKSIENNCKVNGRWSSEV